MSKCIRDNARCSGCGVCRQVCPKGAISLRVDAKGFPRPAVGDNCIDCGLCVRHCHEHKRFDGYRVQKAFTAYSNDPDIRAVSSSGGMFTALAVKVIEDGGFVCASGFDGDFVLRHRIIDTIEQLDGLRKSKYLESDMSSVWQELKQRVASGRKGLFVGTPCQCSALRSFLGDKIDDIIVCDFICHGVASPLVFEKYKDYLKSKYGGPVKIEFRHKEKGEGSFFYYEGTDGSCMIPNYKESYPFAYASGLIIADDCTSCSYCKLERYGDITLGDYVSGPTDYAKSTIFANTRKGSDILYQCRDITLQEEDLEDVVGKSWHLTAANTFNPDRQKVFDRLDLPWDLLEKRYFHRAGRLRLYKKALINKLRRFLSR